VSSILAVCTQDYNPVVGWDVLVQGNNQTWNYRVDKTAAKIVINTSRGDSEVRRQTE
jgi:hypothetical protein